MADVPGKFYRATKVRTGVAPSSAGSIEGEVLPPVNPPGSSLNSVGLTMPSAFTVSNSPLTANGTIGVAGAGTVAQYIRGDGSLADFPESSGGGSSVSYYLNGSVDQGTIGGIAYKELSKVPILGAGTDFTINADGYIASFITDAGDPSLLEIPGGNWNFETYFSASSSGGTPTFYVELYKVSGTTATLIASSSSAPELIAFGTNLTPYFSTLAVPTTTLALTDRLAVRYYVTHSGRTITLHTENNHLCQIITTFTTGLTALNGLTAQVQNFAVGTTGTDFNIASATATHTFNLPTASATNRGALSSADWSLFTQAYNDKINSAAVTGTTTKTLTLTQQDGGTITASWSDLNTDAVLSVFGRTGAVVAANGDYTTAQVTESGNLYYTDGRARGSLSFAAGSGAYNTSTGVITIPTNNNQIANGAGYITSAALASYLPLSGGVMTGPITTPNGTFGIVIGDDSRLADRNIANTLFVEGNQNNDRGYINFSQTSGNDLGAINGGNLTWRGNTVWHSGNITPVTSVTASSPLASSGGTTPNITIQQASGSQSGFLSSTDWTTFNNKQNALTNPVTGTGTTNYLPKFTGSTTVGNSNLVDVSGYLVLGNTSSVYGQAGRGTFEMNGSADNILAMRIGGSLAGYLYTNASAMELYSTTILQLSTAGQIRATLSSAGNLILTNGVASDNGARLQVSGAGNTAMSVGGNGYSVFTGSAFSYTPNNIGLSLGYNRSGGNGESTIVWGAPAAGFNFEIASVTSGTITPRLTIASTGAATFSSHLTVTSETTSSSLIQQWVYNGQPTAYRLRLNTLVSSGLVRYSFDTTNNFTEYPNNIVIDRGNVGVGTSPNTKFEVTSGNAASAEIQRWSYNDGNAAYSLRLKQDVSAGLVKHVFDVVNNSTTYANNLVLTNGNVGIGTTSPAYSLDVVSSGGIIGRFTGNSGAYLILRANGVRDWWLANGVNSGTDGWFSIYNATAGSQGLVITSTNNVLIGTQTDNGAKLQVSGTSTLTGNVSIGTSSLTRTLNLDSSDIWISLKRTGNREYLIGSGNQDSFRIQDATAGFDRLTISSTGAATFSSSVTASSFFESSDATLKTLIADNYQAKGIDSVVAKLYIKNGKEELGYFAQDLQYVLPSAVSKGSDGLLNLSYREVHTAKIAYLEERIKQLEKKYENN